LAERLKALRPALIAVEATGGFDTIVTAVLAAAGLPVVVINPAQVRHYAQALGKRAKTDPIDAAVIARFAQADKPEPHAPADATTRVQPQDHIAVAFAWAAERQKPADKLAIEPDPHLTVPALGLWGLIDPGNPHLEGFVGLLGNRDADHAAQPMGPRTAAPSDARLPGAIAVVGFEGGGRRTGPSILIVHIDSFTKQ
jgi:hypothetical protein